MENLKIIRYHDALHVTKPNKTIVDYFLFEEYEIHYNQILPHSIQEWHTHQQVEEVICVVSGQLCCSWVEDGIQKSEIIYPKDLVQVKQSIHTFSNPSDEVCEFLVFRLVLNHQDNRNIFKTDKCAIKEQNSD